MLLSLACCLCCLANSLGTKITYIIWFVAFGVVSWVLRDYGDDIFDSLPGGVDKCRPNDPQDEGLISESECVGKEAVLRMSFGTFLFFLAQAIFLLGCRSPGDPRLVLHKGLWLLKLLAWAGILTGCFYMPAKAIEVYAGFALVFACLFLLLQLVITINYVLKANEWLVDGEEPKAVKKVVLILGTVILYSAGLVVIGWAYHFFAPRGSCSVNIFWITFTLILGLAVTFLSVSKYRIRSAGLLTSAAVFAYCAYLLATALVSEPLNSCVRDELSDDSRWVMVVGFVLGLVAVMICVFSASFQSEVFELKVSEDDGDLETGEKGLDLSLDHRPDFMHLVFALGAAYVGLVLINWNTRDIPDDDFVLDKGWVSAWIKIGTQWVCFVLYAWVLVAPKILKNRNFS